MPRIEKDIVVDVPVTVAYDQWTQFESFPEFMDGVDKVALTVEVVVDRRRLDTKPLPYLAHRQAGGARLVQQGKRLGGDLVARQIRRLAHRYTPSPRLA